MAASRNPECTACSQGRLYRKRLRRRPPALVILGFVVLAPAIVGSASGLYVFFGSLFMEPTLRSNGQPGEELGFFAARAGLFQLLVPSLIALGIGLWLVAKGEAWVCGSCGAQGEREPAS